MGDYRTDTTPEGLARLTILDEHDSPIAEIVQSFDDPGDVGEPRTFTADGVLIAIVPAMSLWAAGHRDEDEGAHDCSARNCRRLARELRDLTLARAEARIVAQAFLRVADDETLGHEGAATVAARRLLR